MKLIGITGYYEAGKDTVAELLVAYGYETLHLADNLKGIAAAIGWDGDKTPDLPPCPACGMDRGRVLLQRLGTEGVRDHLGPDTLMRALERSFSENGSFAVADVRFPNEAEWIRTWGGEVWRVDRPGHEETGHASEKGIAQIVPDLVLINDGTIGELRGEIDVHMDLRKTPSQAYEGAVD